MSIFEISKVYQYFDNDFIDITSSTPNTQIILEVEPEYQSLEVTIHSTNILFAYNLRKTLLNTLSDASQEDDYSTILIEDILIEEKEEFEEFGNLIYNLINEVFYIKGKTSNFKKEVIDVLSNYPQYRWKFISVDDNELVCEVSMSDPEFKLTAGGFAEYGDLDYFIRSKNNATTTFLNDEEVKVAIRRVDELLKDNEVIKKQLENDIRDTMLENAKMEVDTKNYIVRGNDIVFKVIFNFE